MLEVIEFLQKINSSELQQSILLFKIPVLLINLAFVAFIIYAFVKTSWFQYSFIYNINEFFTSTPYGARRLSKRWQQIADRLQTGLESEYKLAVIDVDAMFDEAMIKLAVPGQTAEERIQNVSPAIVPNIAEIDQAHQIRNAAVRDPNFRLSGVEANRVVSIYQKTFENLDLI